MTLKRRSFIAAGALATGVTAYSLQRGLRLPPLHWEPRALASQHHVGSVKLNFDGVIRTTTPAPPATLRLRAYVPEPTISLASEAATSLQLMVNNISPAAQLEVSGPQSTEVTETRDGITRVLNIRFAERSKVSLSWKFEPGAYSFAAIGDTGGGLELQWCLERAAALGARFFLHLGDFNYQPGDYESSVRLFNNAPLPCYVSIGNHDWHDQRTDYPKFLREIGPLNSHFTIGNTRFANIDTGASFIPFSAGLRGRLFDELAQDPNSYASNIAFTHRPLFDPVENSSHDIGNTGERDWLIAALRDNHFSTLLSGHIHIFGRDTIGGIDNIIVGQGLGHQDLITNRDYSKLAIGKVNTQGAVEFEFAALSMPMDMHCHPRNDIVKQSLQSAPHAAQINAIDAACASRKQQSKP